MTSRILLRAPTDADGEEFLARVHASRPLHRPWTYPPATRDAFATWLERGQGDDQCPRLVCRRDGGEIVGMVNISNIVRGGFRSAYTGYYAFAGFERQGLMKEGLQAAARLAFGPLKLHRLEANIQPGNAPSIALAAACGFRLEGFSPRYLKIGGRWRDHERWALVAD